MSQTSIDLTKTPDTAEKGSGKEGTAEGGTTTTALPEPTAGGVAAGGGEIRIRQRIPSLSNDIDNLDLPLESKAQLDRQRREMKAYIERMKKKEQQEKRNGLSTSSETAGSTTTTTTAAHTTRPASPKKSPHQPKSATKRPTVAGKGIPSPQKAEDAAAQQTASITSIHQKSPSRKKRGATQEEKDIEEAAKQKEAQYQADLERATRESAALSRVHRQLDYDSASKQAESGNSDLEIDESRTRIASQEELISESGRVQRGAGVVSSAKVRQQLVVQSSATSPTVEQLEQTIAHQEKEITSLQESLVSEEAKRSSLATNLLKSDLEPTLRLILQPQLPVAEKTVADMKKKIAELEKQKTLNINQVENKKALKVESGAESGDEDSEESEEEADTRARTTGRKGSGKKKKKQPVFISIPEGNIPVAPRFGQYHGQKHILDPIDHEAEWNKRYKKSESIPLLHDFPAIYQHQRVKDYLQGKTPNIKHPGATLYKKAVAGRLHWDRMQDIATKLSRTRTTHYVGPLEKFYANEWLEPYKLEDDEWDAPPTVEDLFDNNGVYCIKTVKPGSNSSGWLSKTRANIESVIQSRISNYLQVSKDKRGVWSQKTPASGKEFIDVADPSAQPQDVVTIEFFECMYRAVKDKYPEHKINPVWFVIRLLSVVEEKRRNTLHPAVRNEAGEVLLLNAKLSRKKAATPKSSKRTKTSRQQDVSTAASTTKSVSEYVSTLEQKTMWFNFKTNPLEQVNPTNVQELIKPWIALFTDETFTLWDKWQAEAPRSSSTGWSSTYGQLKTFIESAFGSSTGPNRGDEMDVDLTGTGGTISGHKRDRDAEISGEGSGEGEGSEEEEENSEEENSEEELGTFKNEDDEKESIYAAAAASSTKASSSTAAASSTAVGTSSQKATKFVKKTLITSEEALSAARECHVMKHGAMKQQDQVKFTIPSEEPDSETGRQLIWKEISTIPKHYTTTPGVEKLFSSGKLRRGIYNEKYQLPYGVGAVLIKPWDYAQPWIEANRHECIARYGLPIRATPYPVKVAKFYPDTYTEAELDVYNPESGSIDLVEAYSQFLYEIGYHESQPAPAMICCMSYQDMITTPVVNDHYPGVKSVEQMTHLPSEKKEEPKKKEEK